MSDTTLATLAILRRIADACDATHPLRATARKRRSMRRDLDVLIFEREGGWFREARLSMSQTELGPRARQDFWVRDRLRLVLMVCTGQPVWSSRPHDVAHRLGYLAEYSLEQLGAALMFCRDELVWRHRAPDRVPDRWYYEEGRRADAGRAA